MPEFFVEGTERLEADLNRLPQAFSVIHARYSQALAGGWKKWILEVDAVKTRKFLFSVAARVAAGGEDAKAFVIETPGVHYSDIVERGRLDGNYAKGKPYRDEYGGRHPAGRSLDEQHDADLLDQISTKGLSEFLHG